MTTAWPLRFVLCALCALCLSLADARAQCIPGWVESPASVVPRSSPSAAFDSFRGKVVSFGGFDGVGYFGETLEYDGAAWTAVGGGVAPNPREGAVLVYDSARRKVVLFGGNEGSLYYADTWEWDGSVWAQTTPPEQPPGAGVRERGL